MKLNYHSKNLQDFVCFGRKILGAAENFYPKGKEPEHPVIYLKPTTSYLVEGQAIVIPKMYNEVTAEVQLGVIIGDRAKYHKKETAMECVGGYCLAMGLTADCEMSKMDGLGYPWAICKGFDTSTPVSRFIPSQLLDPRDTDLWLKVNGEERQRGNTRDMAFDIPFIISYISQYITLEPGDLILTGPPVQGAKAKAGDSIESGISNLLKIRFDICVEY